jgi:UDP-2-acetamido-2-deoxy-ribo-hexuluronate aminotransferase
MARDLLLDVNVVLDICLPRPAFAPDALRALDRCHQEGGRLWLYAGSVQTLEYTLLNSLLQQARTQGTPLSRPQAQYLSRQLLQAFCADKSWLAALAGDGHVFDAPDPEDEQLVRALQRRRPGSMQLLTRDQRLIDTHPTLAVTPAAYLAEAARPQPPLDFIDLRSQQDACRSALEDRLHRVLDHGQYIMGPEVKQLETALAERVGAKHCVTVSSGTEALLIALMALDLLPGDEVITTPFTFAATAEVIALLGARPVFVDIEPDTCNLDPSLIEAAITPKTRAIMPVSLYGQVADMAEINAIAARHHLPVIEDAAQSFGATYRGGGGHTGHSGHLSTIGCTSFFPSKPLGCYGDGGALFTDDDTLAQAAREIRVHGQSARYTHTRVGLGGRMDTLQCAVVLAKLPRFDWELQRRRELGARYHQLLAPLVAQHPGFGLLTVRPDRDSVWGQYTVFVPQRAAVQATLQAAGIPTAVHYPKPLHHQVAYAAFCCPDCCPHSVAAADRVMSLPMSPDLSEADQDRVVAALAEALACCAPR